MLKTLADVFGIFATRGAGGAGTGIASLVAAAETNAAEGVGATPADDDATGCETDEVSAGGTCVVAAEKGKEAIVLLTVDELLNTGAPKTGRLKTGAEA
jgi:hypothetical protein